MSIKIKLTPGPSTWTCPQCGTVNETDAGVKKVDCFWCGNEYKVKAGKQDA